MLERAISIAVEAHRGQLDKAGAPYILHPLRVMLAVSTEQERIVAVLHDVLEDCPTWTPARLVSEGFGPEIITALMLLTRQRGETYTAFIERLKPNALARTVKLADLADNANLSRLPIVTDKDRARREKYELARLELLAA